MEVADRQRSNTVEIATMDSAARVIVQSYGHPDGLYRGTSPKMANVNPKAASRMAADSAIEILPWVICCRRASNQAAAPPHNPKRTIAQPSAEVNVASPDQISAALSRRAAAKYACENAT